MVTFKLKLAEIRGLNDDANDALEKYKAIKYKELIKEKLEHISYYAYDLLFISEGDDELLLEELGPDYKEIRTSFREWNEAKELLLEYEDLCDEQIMILIWYLENEESCVLQLPCCKELIAATAKLYKVATDIKTVLDEQFDREFNYYKLSELENALKAVYKDDCFWECPNNIKGKEVR